MKRLIELLRDLRNTQLTRHEAYMRLANSALKEEIDGKKKSSELRDNPRFGAV